MSPRTFLSSLERGSMQRPIFYDGALLDPSKTGVTAIELSLLTTIIFIAAITLIR
jgi:hypothetical protein